MNISTSFYLSAIQDTGTNHPEFTSELCDKKLLPDPELGIDLTSSPKGHSNILSERVFSC